MLKKSQIKHSISKFYANYKKSNHSRILYYHDVHLDNINPKYKYSTPESHFLMHIETIIKSDFEIVKRITKPYNQVLITFDDGYRGIIDIIDKLEEMKVYVMIFMITSMIGDNKFLSKDEIIELEKSEYFSFGAHSHTHSPLIKCDQKQLEYEIRKSHNILSETLNVDVIDFAFPIGKFNDKVIDECLRLGFSQLYSAIPGIYYNNEKFIFRNLAQDLNQLQFENLLQGGYDIFQYHYKRLSRKI